MPSILLALPLTWLELVSRVPPAAPNRFSARLYFRLFQQNRPLADVKEAADLVYSSAAVTTFDIILEPPEVATKDWPVDMPQC